MEFTTVKTKNILVHVITIKLTKDNYLHWAVAITMGIAGRDRIKYINGRKKIPSEDDPEWRFWYLEDNQVRTWIINSVFSDFQLLILRKDFVREM